MKRRDPQKLSHIGLGRCLDGWVILGYTPKQSVLEPIYIPEATLPTTPWAMEASEHPFSESIKLSLSSASNDMLEGTVSVLRRGQKSAEQWTFKAKPKPLAAAKNMGHLGCHHTGFARLSLGTEKTTAPVRSIYKTPESYRISVALNPTHRVEVWFNLPTYKRKPGHLIKADLKALLENPEGFEQRVIFEHLDAKTNRYVRSPAITGDLEIKFEQNKEGGPVRFTLTNLRVDPTWPVFGDALQRSPLTIKGLVEFSTDRMGRQVPIRRMPRD